MSVHDLSESTKRIIDAVPPLLTAAAAGASRVSLNDVAVIVTIVVGLLSAAWYIVRFHDRIKYGRSPE